MAEWHGLYSVTWNVTKKCNFSCKHCYVSKYTEPDLSTEEAKDMINQIADFGVKELYMSGGEPLMREDIFDLAKYSVDLGLHTDVITNGWFVDREIAKKFKDSGVNHVSVSVDGFEDTHDYIRNKPGSFKKCMEAIKILRDADVKTFLAPTFSKYNLHQLQDLMKLAEKMDSSFSCKVMIPMGNASNLKEKCLNPEEQREFYEGLLARRNDPENKLEIVTTCDPYSIFLEKGEDLPTSEDRILGGCTGGITLICIGADGTVTPCSRLQLPVGNIRRESLEKMWYNSDVLKTLRDRDNLKGKCGTCKYRNLCGGCRAMAMAQTGDPLAEDPTCWLKPESG